ncbi:MAG TPA: DUF58 domain-containing protein [Holophagaceae bacterium]|nr:DUF58 domain-containing protein [Holophagaceae bacterium]
MTPSKERQGRVLPGRPLILAAAGWALFAVAAAFAPPLLPAWRAAGWGLAAFAALDLGALLLVRNLSVERRAPFILPNGAPTPVRLKIHNAHRIPVRLTVHDGHPGGMEAVGLPHALRLPARGWAEHTYRLRPAGRGAFAFMPADLMVKSPLGLFERALKRGPEQPFRVYPDFAAVRKFALMATRGRLAQLGVHRKRRRGEGMEFHQLREYRVGDALRQIDWMASARVHKLISRDYQDERDQRVLFLLDCGRRMRALEAGLSHFDHTLNAMLLLSYVALREGDGVGLMSFSGPERWLPPMKGPATLDRIMDLVHDLEPENRATDYLAAAEALVTRFRKRALVVLVTNLRDEDDDTLRPAMALLRKRHRVLLASLRERALDEALEAPVTGFDSALLHGSVHAYLADRKKALDRLAVLGAPALDLLPEQLPLALVNRYLALKRGGEL